MSTKLKSQTIEGVWKSGDSFVLEVDVLNDSDVAVPMTGATIRFQMARNKNEIAVISSDDSPGPSIAIGPNDDSPSVENRVTITVDDSQTAPLDGTYYFEAEAVDGSLNRATFIYGFVTFDPDLIL